MWSSAGLTLPRQGAVAAPGADDGEEAMPLIGRSPAMQEIYRIMARLMATDLTVMITGESGTGKELVARALHDYGRRRSGPFVAINMAAIPRDLIESELFGHEKGAFTGALSRSTGRFEQAQGGTLFLDEIGDMPLEAQTRLLRVLQEGEYTSVGGRTTIRTNVRIVAATHRDLRTLVRQGLFREDLFYRLERRADPPAAAARAVGGHPGPGQPFHAPRRGRGDEREGAGQAGDGTADAASLARQCPRARESGPSAMRPLFAGDDRRRCDRGRAGVTPCRSPDRWRPGPSRPGRGCRPRSSGICATISRRMPAACPASGLYDRVLREVERPLITLSLTATRGNQIRAAELLGLNRNTLRKKIRELDIPVVRGLS